ncbi:hypothetical protein ACQKND_04135 [Viridibacillus arvi]|uniref:hypothetical protein n=1 Tax=Viridibacillus arvi TaxID=263475 RepID=UPI003CFF770A
MKFLEQHPDYKNYLSEKYYTDQMPTSFYNAFQSLIVGKAINDDESPERILKQACEIIATSLHLRVTSEWGYQPLIEELNYYLSKTKDEDFPKQMDIIGEISSKLYLDADTISEVFQEQNIGYKYLHDSYVGAIWNLINEQIEINSDNISEAIELVDDAHVNVIQHLEQAKEQLSRIDNPRARKDALRDCVSALESQVKYLSGEKDFKNGVYKLRNSNFGNTKIIKDASTMWTFVHEDIQDIRHGHAEEFSITVEEALYYIDRITALIKYLSRV